MMAGACRSLPQSARVSVGLSTSLPLISIQAVIQPLKCVTYAGVAECC
jgi:hypothetical protein